MQNYFRDYYLSNENEYYTLSNRDLKTFESIQIKYKNKNFSSFINNMDIKQDELWTEEEIVNRELDSTGKKEHKTKNVLRCHKNIERKNQNNINNNFERNTKSKKDFSSDIEPLHQDDDIFVIISDDTISKNNFYEIGKNKDIKIRYNIIKNQNKDRNNSERSSMDGSIDEIITKKLKEVHNNNEKYTQRILKAYNQVKYMKSYSLEKNKFFNSNYKYAKFFNNNY